MPEFDQHLLLNGSHDLPASGPPASAQCASRITKTVASHRLRICHTFKVRTGMELAAKLREIPPSLWQAP